MHMVTRILPGLFVVAAAIGACGPGGRGATARGDYDRQNELASLLRPAYRIRRPADSARRVVVLIVPGCSGFGAQHYDTEAAGLTREGFIVANVDYLAARGIPTACPAAGDTAFPVPATVVAEYVLAAAIDMRSDPSIRATQVFGVGGSLGGGGVLAALSGDHRDGSPLDGVAVLYPQCRGVPAWTRPTRALMLLGEFDNIAPPALCRSLVEQSSGTIDVHVYPRAHHAFDADELGRVAEPRTEPTVAFDPDAAADAWRRIAQFFRR